MNLILVVALSQALLAAPAAPAPPTVQPESAAISVTVTTQASGPDVVYRTVVRNTSSAQVAATVKQQLPDGVTRATASNKGVVHGDEIQWTATVPAGGTVTLNSKATVPVPRPSAVSSVCVADPNGTALDCTSAVAAAVTPPEPPLWRRLLPWAVGLLALGVLVWAGWRLWKRKPARKPRPARAPRSTRDMTWTAVGISAVAVLGVVAAVLLLAAPVVKSTVTRATSTQGGGWSGTQTPLALGAPASDSVVEFTVYQAECTKGKSADCTVVAAVRNTGGQPQLFYSSMQRVYTAPNDWVTPDNPGVFAQPLAAGARRLVTLHFALPAGQHAQRLELREGAFARGVYYDL